MRYLLALGFLWTFQGLVVAGDAKPDAKGGVQELGISPFLFVFTSDRAAETLCPLLAKADVVVVGEFAGEPVGRKVSGDAFVYDADFQVAQVVKADAAEEIRVGAKLKVAVLVEERPPELTKGGKCLLFLKCDGSPPKASYVTADLWYGLQRPSAGLTKSLSRIVAAQAKCPLHVPAAKDIEQFTADPVAKNTQFKNFKVDKARLLKILRDYHAIPQHDWNHQYSHVAGEDRTGVLNLHDKTRIEFMVRPGGLAMLTYPDGRKLYLADEKLK